MNIDMRFTTWAMKIEQGETLDNDIIRMSVNTQYPDQTGFMSHNDIPRADIPVFWLGVNAVARTWVRAGSGLVLPQITDRTQ